MSKLALSEIPAIKDGKSLLQEILDVALSLEQLQEGLKAVLFLGEPDTTLPPDIRTFFAEIGDRLKQAKKEKLYGYISKLDVLIEKDLQQVIEISELSTRNNTLEDFPVQSIELVESFRRRALTSISLRMLLRKRGQEAPRVAFDLPQKLVKKQINKLEVIERAQRNKAVRQIRTMIDDLTRLMHTESYNEDNKSIFQNVINGLHNDIAAINRGEKLENLPLSFEQVEEDAFWHTPFYQLDAAGGEEAHAPQAQSTPADSPANGKADAGTALTFFQKFRRWLNSPWKVSWKQIGKGK